MSQYKYKILISGGGTGGHVFPAISIAKAIKRRFPESEILFVGAQNRIEMEKVPNAGFEIIGLPVIGFERKLSFKNIVFFFKLAQSLLKAKRIVKSFKPNIAIGVGGFASGPVLYYSSRRKIPTLLQEQNSFAGVTNKILGKKASKICVAYENMDRYFSEEKIILTGNPIRKDLYLEKEKIDEAYQYFNLNKEKKVLLIIGGSLGARTINHSVRDHISNLSKTDIQIIWQTGKYFIDEANRLVKEIKAENIHVHQFINRMDYAFAVANLVVSRAGAGTISELAVLGKPVILVPSPNVSEDHQTKNAMALVEKEAAVLIKDNVSKDELIPKAMSLLDSNEELKKLSDNILKLALPKADETIVDEVQKILELK
jgi:UDP-N-acetylglucosamine--N-acetylmuramyl-(pentapeptide) pyrophosphoryl-undecaprenol N-acetylglucosamine transferase